ncbi:MAG: ATP-binding cassette domain-containing protein, partial [Bradyrhizobium sp.]
MSLGVNLLAAVVERVAKALDESFDIEVVETHHRIKVDAPSGTALMLGQAAATGRALVEDALRRTGLTDFRNTYPKQLSGGMRQRVGISRALAVRPAILLMDEPLSALDSQTRELLMEDFVRLLADGGMGAVYVTHNLEEAARLADRIVVLSRRPGRIREVVAVSMTRAERGDIAAREKLLALQNQIWSLIRTEAIDAEREVQHA